MLLSSLYIYSSYIGHYPNMADPVVRKSPFCRTITRTAQARMCLSQILCAVRLRAQQYVCVGAVCVSRFLCVGAVCVSLFRCVGAVCEAPVWCVRGPSVRKCAS